MEDLKKLTINFSLFATNQSSSSTTLKSPKNFENNRIVGLGIVAALKDADVSQQLRKSSITAFLSVNCPRSNSNSRAIPVSSSSAKTKSEKELMEMSESYTCVISHRGNEPYKKQEYYENCQITSTTTTTNIICTPMRSERGVFSSSPYFGEVLQGAGSFWNSDFLSSCSLCNKKLHGLDIFMYRGEKAFCSIECRAKHIASDDHKEKCRTRAMRSLDQSCSCSSPMPFFAGVAAA